MLFFVPDMRALSYTHGGWRSFGSPMTECWAEGATMSLLSSEASFFWAGGFGGLPLPHIQTLPSGVSPAFPYHKRFTQLSHTHRKHHVLTVTTVVLLSLTC